MQTPVGVLVDRYGARRLLAIAAFLCALGVFWISFAHSFYSAFLSRLMMGFGASFAFVALLVLALNWFPRRQFGLFAGIAQFLGAVGPILAGAPLVYLLGKVDNNWRLILFWLGIFGIPLSLSIGFFIRNKPKGKKNQIIFLNPHESLKERIALLLKIPQTWWVIFYAACIYASLPLLGAVWGTTYLMKRGLDHASAAFVTSMLWFGMAIGCPLWGKISDKMKRRKPLLFFCALLGIGISMIVLYVPVHEKFWLSITFLVLGIASAGQSLSFATISEHVPTKLHGAALGLNNTAITFFAVIIPPFASSIIQLSAKDILHSNVRLYPLESFTRGLSVMPFLFAIAFFIALFAIRETYCRQQHEVHVLRPYISTNTS